MKRLREVTASNHKSPTAVKKSMNMSENSDLALEAEVMSSYAGSDSSAHDVQVDPAARREAALVTVGRRAAQFEDQHALMRDAAALLAETLDMDHCATVQQPTGSAKMRFWLGQTSDAAEGGAGQEIELRATDTGSIATYAMTAQHVVVASDIAHEKRFVDLFLREQGIQCGIVCPLHCNGRVYGALGVLSTEPREFDRSDVIFVDAIAGVLSTTVAHQQACHELDERQRFEEAVLGSIDAMILELTPEAKIISFNRTCSKITGFEPEELRERAIWSAFMVPEEIGVITRAFERLEDGESPVEFESYLLTKAGDRRRIAWSYSVLEDAPTGEKKLLGTGIDVTRQHKMQEELASTQAAAEAAKEELDSLMARVESGEAGPGGSNPFKRLPDGVHKDRRTRPRRSYPYAQLIAPMIDNKRPQPSAFREVRCRDIAAGGFSYLSPDKPDYQELVIGFGAAPAITYVKAKIVHYAPIEIDGHTQYNVGCCYTGRVEY